MESNPAAGASWEAWDSATRDGRGYVHARGGVQCASLSHLPEQSCDRARLRLRWRCGASAAADKRTTAWTLGGAFQRLQASPTTRM
eukprot:scaffold25428_cov101-Isochrysis_galbana.AAC.1